LTLAEDGKGVLSWKIPKWIYEFEEKRKQFNNKPMKNTVMVEASWRKYDYLQDGILKMVCDCYHCNGNCKDCSWCERPRAKGKKFGQVCPVEEMSDKEIENSRSLFEQTYCGHYQATPYETTNGYIISGNLSGGDFHYTEQDIENHIIPEEYRNKIHVKFNYLQDDREFKANSLDGFF